MPLLNKLRVQIWVYEIAHGCTQFASRSLMLETCAGVTEFDSWEELGKMLDKAISVDGQKVARVVNIGDMRSTGEFYDAIGNAHKQGKHDHPVYHLPAIVAVAQHATPPAKVDPISLIPPGKPGDPFTPFFEAHKHEGSTYQPAMRRFLIERPELRTMVETGSGCSTCYFVMAMQERGGDGHLYSIDPAPWCNYDVQHARVTNIRKRSADAMAELYLQTGPWDFFLHDGNHDLTHQKFDIEMGYACLRPGGWMWCDDYTWGEHHAWKSFAKANRLALLDFGSASAIQKPMHSPALIPAAAVAFSKTLFSICRSAGDAWRAQGHEDSAVFANQNP